ncbi:MAG: phosphoribosylanthranilate isomerase [Gammaproteobacteria bacterium]|nr:phosphoribosylanthranilate isomerase [Gammaproteobacteria bacterium]MBU1653974.1 phosphoribosylanthranilate isomerase [Gammaproteobacteria bacterium]MBU1960474.1 phosphoribosylanthranilate isomerase [Gammaproteobacteria bacterium]
MNRTRVKTCGITRPGDALVAVEAGADAIGLVFYPPSPRCVSIEQAESIVSRLPPFVSVVGLFVNAERGEIEAALKRVSLDLIQFHGNECPDYCAGFGRPYIKAIRVKEDTDLRSERARYRQARALLLDTYRPGVPGGTGERFDWSLIPPALAGEVVLAGGLDAGNIETAIRQVRPYAVDVSGGLEAAKGIKDPEKIRAFMRGVRRADED